MAARFGVDTYVNVEVSDEIPKFAGLSPAYTVATTVLVAVSITEAVSFN